MDIGYPNQCVVCESTNTLSRCSRCKMVSYCGSDHQKQNWPAHKNVCKAISQILKEKGMSYIFEKLPLSDSTIWEKERNRKISEIQKKLKRPLNADEHVLFMHPRICFVCREAKQDKLKNCPNCPSASFCDRHPSSEIHNKHCSIVRNSFVRVTTKKNFDSKTTQLLVESVAAGTKFLKSEKPPTSINAFFDHYTQPEKSISELDKIFLSEFFTIPLTFFSVLKRLYDTVPSEIVIHLAAGANSIALTVGSFWETLLHLLPDVKILKIVYVEGTRTDANEVILCKECNDTKRQLLLTTNSMSYDQFMAFEDYEKPAVLSYLNIGSGFTISAETGNEVNLGNRIKSWRNVTCPILLTMDTEIEAESVREHLSKSFKNFRVVYSGNNQFAPLMFHQKLPDGYLTQSLQSVIIYKPKKTKSNSKSLCKVKKEFQAGIEAARSVISQNKELKAKTEEESVIFEKKELKAEIKEASVIFEKEEFNAEMKEACEVSEKEEFKPEIVEATSVTSQNKELKAETEENVIFEKKEFNAEMKKACVVSEKKEFKPEIEKAVSVISENKELKANMEEASVIFEKEEFQAEIEVTSVISHKKELKAETEEESVIFEIKELKAEMKEASVIFEKEEFNAEMKEACEVSEKKEFKPEIVEATIVTSKNKELKAETEEESVIFEKKELKAEIEGESVIFEKKEFNAEMKKACVVSEKKEFKPEIKIAISVISENKELKANMEEASVIFEKEKFQAEIEEVTSVISQKKELKAVTEEESVIFDKKELKAEIEEASVISENKELKANMEEASVIFEKEEFNAEMKEASVISEKKQFKPEVDEPTSVISENKDFEAEMKEATTVISEKKEDIEKNHVSKMNSLLKSENEKLRNELNFANAEIEQLQNRNLKLEEIFTNFIDKNYLLKETLRDLDESISSVLDKNNL